MITLTGANHQVLLPSAEFADEHTLDSALKLKKMMDGSKKSFIRTPAISTLNLEIRNVNRNLVEQVRLFLIATAGQQLTMQLWDLSIWKGRIINTPMSFTHAAIRDNQFTIQFEGFKYA